MTRHLYRTVAIASVSVLTIASVLVVESVLSPTVAAWAVGSVVVGTAVSSLAATTP